MSDSTTNLLAIKIGNTAAESNRVTLNSVTEHLTSNIQGSAWSFDDEHLAFSADLAAISKVYKLGAVTGTSKGQKSGSLTNGSTNDSDKAARRIQVKDLETHAMAMMALKGS